MAFQTVIVTRGTRISLDLGNLKVVYNSQIRRIPLCNINAVMLMHADVVFTVQIISAFLENNINVILCDEKNDPQGIFLPLHNHHKTYFQIGRQLEWKKTNKKSLWKQIVEEKIKSQKENLEYIGCDKNIISIVNEYQNGVLSNDSTNREAVVAKLYFLEMFGRDFTRDQDISINYALNYGYKIIASYISKQIAARGYLTSLGIFHHSRTNSFNFTYDVIEIFRFVVDRWVYENISNSNVFLIKDKYKIINLLNATMEYKQKRYRIVNIIEYFFDDIVMYLEDDIDKVEFPLYSTFRENDE